MGLPAVRRAWLRSAVGPDPCRHRRPAGQGDTNQPRCRRPRRPVVAAHHHPESPDQPVLDAPPRVLPRRPVPVCCAQPDPIPDGRVGVAGSNRSMGGTSDRSTDRQPTPQRHPRERTGRGLLQPVGGCAGSTQLVGVGVRGRRNRVDQRWCRHPPPIRHVHPRRTPRRHCRRPRPRNHHGDRTDLAADRRRRRRRRSHRNRHQRPFHVRMEPRPTPRRLPHRQLRPHPPPQPRRPQRHPLRLQRPDRRHKMAQPTGESSREH